MKQTRSSNINHECSCQRLNQYYTIKLFQTLIVSLLTISNKVLQAASSIESILILREKYTKWFRRVRLENDLEHTVTKCRDSLLEWMSFQWLKEHRFPIAKCKFWNRQVPVGNVRVCCTFASYSGVFTSLSVDLAEVFASKNSKKDQTNPGRRHFNAKASWRKDPRCLFFALRSNVSPLVSNVSSFRSLFHVENGRRAFEEKRENSRRC